MNAFSLLTLLGICIEADPENEGVLCLKRNYDDGRVWWKTLHSIHLYDRFMEDSTDDIVAREALSLVMDCIMKATES